MAVRVWETCAPKMYRQSKAIPPLTTKDLFFFIIVAVNQYKQAPINNILQKKTFAILAV